ncbi:MAG: hypothetical protein JRG86_11100 [Deltaproteobacteria bacterium]|jgi:aspartate-semialdehyde dehydrogenase|nr:hypothetical protein [Deltaproteobacteria bacterium]MBW2496479.1 hypothetical protein [Deltaproteobacteria bacterium]
MGESRPLRIVVFGATGHLGQQLLRALEESDWPIAELVGVGSEESAGAELEFRGEPLDVASEWPPLKGRDLVFVCTPSEVALEIVREALRAEVPCIDCSGALAAQAEVPMPVRAAELEGEGVEGGAALASAPLLEVASPTALAWVPILEALSRAAGVERLVATVLCSAAAWGRRGLVSLSEETIALFNQAASPDTGPAGQTVAFDVIPGGGIDEARVEADLERLFDGALRVSLTSAQVPTFVGEGSALSLELASPIEQAALESLLEAVPGVTLVAQGIGSRGLAAVEEGVPEPAGPTLRDSVGSGGILVGRLRPDPSLPAGLGWRLWASFDPLALTSEHALRLGALRLGLA